MKRKSINFKKYCKFLLIVFIMFFAIKVDAGAYLELDGRYMWESKNTNDVKMIYAASDKKIVFDIYTTSSKLTIYDQLVQDEKTSTLVVNMSNSSNISCTIANLKTTDYTLSGNTFTLKNDNATSDKIGTITCTLPTTSNHIKISKSYWLNIQLNSTIKDFALEEDNTKQTKKYYRYNFGVINQSYLNSLNNQLSLTSVSFNDKVYERELFKIYDVNDSSLKMKINQNSNGLKNKFYLTAKVGNKTVLEDVLLTSLERTINLDYGENCVYIEEVTEKEAFLDSLADSDYEQGFSDNAFDGNSSIDYYCFNRLDNRSKVNTLKSLTVSSVALNFNPALKNYIASVPYKVSKITISSTLTDAKSSYVSGFGNRTVNLKQGLNTVLVKVKAENGSIATYTIKITREANNDSSLKSLTVNDKAVSLKQGLLIYTIPVNNEVTKATVKAVANDAKAKVAIGEVKELQVGDNEVEIVVTAANGMKSVYVVNIVRDKLISTNSKLQKLKVKNHKIDFNSDTLEYFISLDSDERKLELEVETEHEKASYIIAGNKNLEDGSVVKVKVTAEDGVTTTTYSINIEKATNYFLYILIGGISLILIIIVIIIMIIKKRKKNKGINQNNVNQVNINYEEIGPKKINT